MLDHLINKGSTIGRRMDEEERIFYESEVDFFGDHNEIFPLPNSTSVPPLVRDTSVNSMAEDGTLTVEGFAPSLFRAFNPSDRLRDMPEDKQNEYAFMFNNHKRFNGIQHFFEFGNSDKFTGDFLQNIESDALGNNGNGDFDLEKLFHGDTKHTYKQQIQNTLIALNKKMQEVNHKSLGSINLNRTISNAFYEHFENFSLVFNSTNFSQEFQTNLRNMMVNCKKFKGPGMDLIASIYEFWMKSFKDFVQEIWKYSSKFTLNFFKKDEFPQHEACDSNNFSDIRSESSNANTMGSKDKRKGWTIEETHILQDLIDSNMIFSQSVLKKIATQFSRSVTSISSKIQKLTKARKGEQTQEESLLRKAIQILKMNPEGLNKDTIIEKINENYQMGYGGQWQKSVGQLLSSKKQFIKIRGKHKLINPNLYAVINPNEVDFSKLTFKDKVIQSLLSCPNAEADLKRLVDAYMGLFKEGDHQSDIMIEQRKKSIQANISKTLSRYEIFDNSRARTIYLLNPLFSKPESRNMDIEVEDYFTL